MRAHKLTCGIIISIMISGCSFGSIDNGEVIQSEVNDINLSGLLSIEPSIEIPEWKKERKNFSVIFTGDVMLGRYVETLMNRNGINYPFEMVSDRLNLADEVVINLEGPILPSDKHIPTPSFTTNFSFDEKVLNVFEQNNIGIVNLANNHTYDKGADVFAGMTSILEEKGIDWFGHPLEYNNKYSYSLNANGVDINLLGYHQATVSNFDTNSMKESIESIVDAEPGSLNVVNLHFGPEYQPMSSDIQKEIARAAIDAGADMVIGHHPHVVHEMEVYKGKPIFYSLGNFIFDQYFSDETQEGLAVELNIEFKDFNKNFEFANDPYSLLGGKFEIEKVGVRLLPLKSNTSQPYFLGSEEYKDWVNSFASKSKIGNTEGDYFYEWSY